MLVKWSKKLFLFFRVVQILEWILKRKLGHYTSSH
jgi:hypothetical protein